ncbi:uncharacterized protein LOC116774911 [Danaus plexippus]|uniref:uncharacterized protein LOC116774911 n=1 Tax=Danaus plexippus TaxID=13037 RepID=UPI002AB1CC4A|nr:uncharacterized protein LOC116774911 [Danaus plexippus]
MFLLLVVLIVTDLALASDSLQDTSAYNKNVAKSVKKTNIGALGFFAAITNNQVPVNKTYFERDENQLRIPKNIYEDSKKKKIKKVPKRTIQKIIKKGKNRSRKIYVNPATRSPTNPPMKYLEQDSNEGYSPRKEEVTTDSNSRKKPRKSPKFARYPMPFHKFQNRKDGHNRFRRQLDRDDVYILKDLDEIKFLSKEKDYDVIQANVQKHW